MGPAGLLIAADERFGIALQKKQAAAPCPGGAGDQQGMSVVIASFGYKYGIPQEADLVFDVRFLPNPYYVPELKEKNGTDKASAASGWVRRVSL